MICLLVSHYCPLLHSGPACPPISSYLLTPADPSRQLLDLALLEKILMFFRCLPFLEELSHLLVFANTLVPSCPGSSLRVVFIPCDSLVLMAPPSVQTSSALHSVPPAGQHHRKRAQAPWAISRLAQGSAPQPVTSVHSLDASSAGSNAPEAARDSSCPPPDSQPRHPAQNTVPSVLLSGPFFLFPLAFYSGLFLSHSLKCGTS